MDRPVEAPPAEPEEPEEPKASRLTTIVLTVSLVLVVVVAGVLGTVAVLMTKSPDSPLLGGAPPQRLATPIHFAPVKETKTAPCPGDPAVLDEQQTTCYLLEDGVTVGAVQRIEAVRGADNSYSVRIAVAPVFKDRLVRLIDELQPTQRQVAIVLAPEGEQTPKTVLAAPVVTQSMDGDSLSIAGFTKEEADALVVRMLGAPPSQPSQPAQPQSSQPGTDQQPQQPTNQQPTDQQQPTNQQPPNQQQPNQQPQQPTDPGQGTATTGTTAPAGVARVPDKRYASCKEAQAAGDGPYTRGRHEEYSWYPDLDHNGVACNSADIR
ncbi:excalibur calcium-binding domain-containing protein [Nonomuraea sp. NPDC049655]|uniref:excalibur calcium-binding domain-containing protein n=1 Tax=Nonomuraea sp. NPDC049655 TaxID=3364355 RepID=UPI0037AC6DCE